MKSPPNLSRFNCVPVKEKYLAAAEAAMGVYWELSHNVCFVLVLSFPREAEVSRRVSAWKRQWDRSKRCRWRVHWHMSTLRNWTPRFVVRHSPRMIELMTSPLPIGALPGS